MVLPRALTFMRHSAARGVAGSLRATAAADAAVRQTSTLARMEDGRAPPKRRRRPPPSAPQRAAPAPAYNPLQQDSNGYARPPIANGASPQGMMNGGAASRTSSTTRSALTSVRFADLGISAPLLRAITEVFGYEEATEVQAESIPVSMTGRDLLVKAKTGTGKTIAFVLPALERVRARGRSSKADGVSILVISPTRELAMQICEEARMLSRFLPGVAVQAVVGGTNVRTDVAKFQREMPTLLVATPGRLQDHLSTPSSGLLSGLSRLGTLVLDEADRLLDMGFRPDLERILAQLPPTSERQTLLFSATMPADVRDMVRLALKPDAAVVDCVGEEVATHERVEQRLVVTPQEGQIPALACCLAEMMRVPDYKILVFFGTARQTQLHAELWCVMEGGHPVLEIHSRKSQGHRNKASDFFRNNSNTIMFSSDVTARGMDFPDVTGIVQVGRPADRDQYIHRLGRTGRGSGAVGKGVLLLTDWEAASFTRLLGDLPVSVADGYPRADLDANSARMSAGFRSVSRQTKQQAYQATLGYYAQYIKALGRDWTKERLVSVINDYYLNIIGEDEVPALRASTVSKMGMKGVVGIRVERGGGGGGRSGNRGAGSSGRQHAVGGGGSDGNAGRGRPASENGRRRPLSAAGPSDYSGHQEYSTGFARAHHPGGRGGGGSRQGVGRGRPGR
ncbi:unnamed protein product [Ostreobium quekettii]|uniref:ATP-dependent RNA helicase n=1 Tax=Ostreobium quekettii TaxID=121088 RepID=A0A8S1J4W7_9CHLO|nr:unnamed protein product [Ostreobium quekettii]